MRYQQPCASYAVQEEVAVSQDERVQAPEGLSEHLWAEHGWSLTGQDVVGLLIGVLVLSIFLV